MAYLAEKRDHAPEGSWVWFLAAISLLLAVAAFVMQRRGISTSPDGIVYTSVASNLARGRGLSVPFTIYTDHYTPSQSIAFDYQVPLRQWPPLWPAVLSLLVRLGASGETATRILNPALLGVNVFLAGVFTRRVFRRSWAVLFTALLTVVLIRDPSFASSSLLYLHVTTLAEPLFLCFVLSTLIFLDRFLASRALVWLVGAAAAASLATLTKVLGLSVVAVVCIVAGLCAGPWLLRLGRMTLCAAIGLTPVLPTLVHASSRTTGPTRNEMTDIVFTELRLGLLEMAPPSVGPNWIRWTFVGAVLIVSMALAALAWRRPECRQGMLALGPTAALSTVLVAQLVLSRSFVDRYVPLIGRPLSLVQLLAATVVLGLLSLSGDSGQVRKRSVFTLAVISTLTIATAGLPLFHAVVDPPYIKNSHAILSSTTATAVGAKDLFSNAPDYLIATTGDPSYLVPCRIDYYGGAIRPEFTDEMDQLVQLVQEGSANVLLVGGRLGAAADCASTSDFDGRPGLTIRQLDRDTALVTSTG
ncbi:unannotated protein [freshwater metagenome]|uniref:Unannotated protein n=1 Tax=freshwater metagenome TaxID=449393 RepID=A0A6J7RQT1_9ZZZZ|nr:hypothetical protein [Actinomycetota bacterium]